MLKKKQGVVNGKNLTQRKRRKKGRNKELYFLPFFLLFLCVKKLFMKSKLAVN